MTLLFALLAMVQTQDPRPGYFQQRADYRIEATLDEPTNVLHGRARLRYTNRSPNALDSMYFHLHLNAFRPNSAWAKRDAQFNVDRFQSLGPDDYAFERLKSVRIEGVSVPPAFPGAPDSTVVAFALPRKFAPGQTITVDIDWDARLSTTPRRQGRRGRHYDFAQWYPKVAVYDRGGWEPHATMPQGEFYGEYGSFDVTFDLASDQVIGSTGVPVEGDPGWKKAAAPGTGDIIYQRNAYPARAAESLGLLTGQPAAARKRVRFRAENVHHFAWTTAPDYKYEQGMWNDVAIHVLYQPDDQDWANHKVVERTATALQWLDHVWGDYAYPQVTNVHRIEGGGTEFPMMVMDGGPDFGLILHEVGHIYSYGILGNNEWKEGFLDEGMTSFQGSWFVEEHGDPRTWTRTMDAVTAAEKSGRGQPITTPSVDFSDFNIYNYETYTKPSIVYRMLREYLGRDTMLNAMRLYYDTFKLSHVTLDDWQWAMEKASGQDLDWFFQQWFRTNGTLDYALTNATTAQQPDGTWKTTLTITRTGENWLPVVVQAGTQRSAERRTANSRETTQTVEILTREKPTEAVIDPDAVLLQTDRTNDRRSL